jgi:hypothetical protein
MSEPSAHAADLEGELRRYFAVTTSTELPRRAAQMSVSTLGSPRRRPLAALLAGAGGLLATAALLVLIATHAGHLGGAGGATSAVPEGSAASAGAGYAAPGQPYPGVDAGRLALAGVRLLPPAGHGTALVGSGQAQAAAVASVGAGAGAPGPAVLAFAELSAPAQQTTCLCWAVDVPVRGGASVKRSSQPARTELVLVDARSGRIAAALTGNGIP